MLAKNLWGIIPFQDNLLIVKTCDCLEGETAAVPARAPAPADPAPVPAAPAGPADPAARGPAAAASRNSFSVWNKDQVEAATDLDIEIEMEDVKEKYHASDVKGDQKFLAATAVFRVELRKRQKSRASEMWRMAAAEDNTRATEEIRPWPGYRTCPANPGRFRKAHKPNTANWTGLTNPKETRLD